MAMTGTSTAQQLTYGERLAVMWLLFWRGLALGALSGAVIGFVLGILVLVVGTDRATSNLIISAVSASVGFFVVGPVLVMPQMLRKKYASFTFEIHRNP